MAAWSSSSPLTARRRGRGQAGECPRFENNPGLAGRVADTSARPARLLLSALPDAPGAPSSVRRGVRCHIKRDDAALPVAGWNNYLANGNKSRAGPLDYMNATEEETRSTVSAGIDR
jgi:hypothetical protein